MIEDTQELQEMFAPRMNVLFGTPKSGIYRYYFYGPVRGPENYIDLINLLDSCGDGDEVHLMINTPGGRLDSTLSIVHAINRTNAHVICHADGDVASAGSVIFFSGHAWVVNPYSVFMLHDGTGGNFGKIGQNAKAAMSAQENLDYLYRSVYKDFFTEDEIEEILKGSDHYSNADEIVERVERVMEDQKNQKTDTESLAAVFEAIGIDKGKIEKITTILDAEDVEEVEEGCGADLLGDLQGEYHGLHVKINNPKLATHGRCGKVIEDYGNEKVKVKLDEDGERKVILIKPENLLIIE